jgi:hypothetical protein
LVYATEQEENNSPSENRDIDNEAFWKKLETIFQETRAIIAEWSRNAGVDLELAEDRIRHHRKRQIVDNHPLVKAGKNYANAASEWFRQFDQDGDDEDARAVIQWYQYQIAVKTIRALSARSEELEEDLESPKDSDGSAKVALIGIDRSIAAWRLMQLASPERAETIVTLILHLERLRTRLEHRFPAARDFVRPGFDEVAAVLSVAKKGNR